MKRIIKWASVLICVTAVLHSGVWSWGQQPATATGKTRFERFRESFGAHQTEPPQREKLRTVTKQRRIIVNDDGNAQYGAESVQEFLSRRFLPTVGTQVDSYFWCVGDGQVPSWGRETPEAIGDAEQVMIDAARQAGMEIFASLRMNDTHDALRPELFGSYALKVQRPDLLLGETTDRSDWPSGTIMGTIWSGFNYAHREVREHRLEFINSVCRGYDFDGLELDFFRAPFFFKFGEEEEHLDTMTGFVRRIRQDLDEIGQARGRPYLLAARVPDTPAQARLVGLDVEQWLVEGLLDLLVVGESVTTMTRPHHQFIDLAHRYGVPVYPCSDDAFRIEVMRAFASNFWAAGADGVYLFNYSPGKISKWGHEIGSPETLGRLDKLFEIEWYGSYYPKYHYASWPHQLPSPLWEWRTLRLVVGDDLEQAAARGWLKELRLQVRVGGIEPQEQITIWVNGVTVPGGKGEPREAREAKTHGWRLEKLQAGCLFDVAVQAPPLRKGTNEIVVELGLNSVGRASATVDRVQLWVRYKQD